MNHPLRNFLRCSLQFMASVVVLTSVSSAQFEDTTGRWRRLDIYATTGFPHDDETSSSIFFRDTSIGFWKGVSGHLYRTSDGGTKWDSVPSSIPIPHTILSGGFGWSEPGRDEFDGVTSFVTYDSGSTWTKLAPGRLP